MGNNEVVGPFGAATVFGSQVPPLALVRARLALLQTRTGQAVDELVRRVGHSTTAENEWGGMQMFLDHPVAADDRRLASVYAHFERNPADLLALAHRRTAGVVLSTVAANLQDCAPFSSTHDAKLSASDKAQSEHLYADGVQYLAAGGAAVAAARLQEAAERDGTWAELRFQQGRAALQLGRKTEAEKFFRAARDLDTLRFRCDSRLNEIIRRVGADRAQQRVALADAERVFAEAAASGVRDRDLFYDHVHLTFQGTYLVARTVAAEVDQLMPPAIKGAKGAPRPWPSEGDCARRLGWGDWARQQVLIEMHRRHNDPPFTAQSNHAELMAHLQAQLRELAGAGGPESLARAAAGFQVALGAAPDDPWLHEQSMKVSRQLRQTAAAESSARLVVALLPENGEGWSQLGLVLADRRNYPEAVACFRRAVDLDPQDVWSLQNLAQGLAKVGRSEDALREYQRAVALKPRFGMAWLGQGQLLETLGRTNEAQACFQKALQNPIRRPAELALLARFCQSRGWMTAAATHYAEAVNLNPVDPALRLEYGQVLAAVGRQDGAAAQFAELVGLAPAMAEAHFLYGVAEGRLGHSEPAVHAFREAARLKPDLLEARINLAIALMNRGEHREAATEFEAVLARSPTNAVASRYLPKVRALLPSGQ
ncbi:MAG: tetratricopeptide repeat protein [Verrucomicrobiota bacterium]